MQIIAPLIPRDVSGLVSETFRVYQGNFGPVVLISLFVQVPTFLSIVAPESALWLLSLAGFVLLALTYGATIHAVAQQYLGGEITLGYCFGRAWQRVIALITAQVLLTLALSASTLLMVTLNRVALALPMAIIIGSPLFVYILVIFFCYEQAIMVEGKGPIAALGRSRQLVEGSKWRVFGVIIVFVLIFIGLSMAGAIVVAIVGIARTTVGNILFIVLATLIIPINYIWPTLVYFDLRVRKEGYNLDVMNSEIAS